MRSSLLASIEVTEFHTAKAYLNLEVSEVKYSIKIRSREGKERSIIADNEKKRRKIKITQYNLQIT